VPVASVEVVTLWYRAPELLLGQTNCGTSLDAPLGPAYIILYYTILYYIRGPRPGFPEPSPRVARAPPQSRTLRSLASGRGPGFASPGARAGERLGERVTIGWSLRTSLELSCVWSPFWTPAYAEAVLETPAQTLSDSKHLVPSSAASWKAVPTLNKSCHALFNVCRRHYTVVH